MGTFRDLNPCSFGVCVLKIREPDGAISACLVQGYFQDYLKLLERRKLKLMQTAGT
jgi:hypothetical protein